MWSSAVVALAIKRPTVVLTAEAPFRAKRVLHMSKLLQPEGNQATQETVRHVLFCSSICWRIDAAHVSLQVTTVFKMCWFFFNGWKIIRGKVWKITRWLQKHGKFNYLHPTDTLKITEPKYYHAMGIFSFRFFHSKILFVSEFLDQAPPPKNLAYI